MKSLFIFLIVLTLLPYSGKVEVIKLPDLKEIFTDDGDKIKIINFWATWCKPCIKEIPLFDQVDKENHNVKVVLVSLDDVEHLESKVLPFVKKQRITSEVKLLDETNYNYIIDEIHSDWTGAIPATIIIDMNGEKHLFEKEFKNGELQELITNFIK